MSKKLVVIDAKKKLLDMLEQMIEDAYQRMTPREFCLMARECNQLIDDVVSRVRREQEAAPQA